MVEFFKHIPNLSDEQKLAVLDFWPIITKFMAAFCDKVFSDDGNDLIITSKEIKTVKLFVSAMFPQIVKDDNTFDLEAIANEVNKFAEYYIKGLETSKVLDAETLEGD